MAGDNTMPRYTLTEFMLTLVAAMIAVALVCSWLKSLHPTVTII